MVTVPVVWLGGGRSWCWDQALIDALLSGTLGFRSRRAFEHHDGTAPDGADGAVVVVPGAYYSDSYEELTDALRPLSWVLLMVVSDEESLFDPHRVDHPNLLCWLQTPKPGVHPVGGDARIRRYLPFGWPPDCRPELPPPGQKRDLDFFFSGQITHRRRQACAAAMRTMAGGWLSETAGFIQRPPDLPERADYYRALASAKVAPCPSGPATPDSFRVWEAIEAGCVPIVDGDTPAGGGKGYWELLLGEEPPFPVVDDWATLPAVTADVLAGWPANQTRLRAWWAGYKRTLAADLDRDLDLLGVAAPLPCVGAEQVTVLVSTSPVPSHPSTTILEETLESIRGRLPDAEIILMADGVRAEQEPRRDVYEEYLSKALDVCDRMGAVLPMVWDRHVHQAAMTRAALEQVRTPLVLFVEHDTPLCGDIPFDDLARVVSAGTANLVRLHHEAEILGCHEYLMLDRQPVGTVPMMRTAQWSQRPHLADADWYRKSLDLWIDPTSTTMIEDALYGPLVCAWQDRGVTGWEEWRTWIYTPPGSIKRSYTTDGRQDDPKFECSIIRPGES